MKISASSLESPHRGDSNEYTQRIIINIKRKSPEIIPNTIMSAAMGLFVRSNSHVKQTISVQATKFYYICTACRRKQHRPRSKPDRLRSCSLIRHPISRLVGQQNILDK